MHTTFNRTKIVATMGPVSAKYEVLVEMVKAGLDVCRLNLSHGDYTDHQATIDLIHRINEEFSLPICTLLDLQGPKLRIGEVQNNILDLQTGNSILITTVKVLGTTERLYVNYENLAQDMKTGEKILIDDGKIELKVTEILDDQTLKAEIIYGGILSSKKGFNLPDTKLSLPSLTEKDLADLEFGLKNDVEWVALSFVRTPQDITYLKELIKKAGKDSKVIAKIEKPEAVKNIDQIIAVSDGIMVARGDLGVELRMEEVPLIQKMIVNKCIIASKPVIIATQMMESMITNATPTRAEANDVANAVLDGADAVMLSAETSVGLYPVKVVESMQRIINNVEKHDMVYFKGKKPDRKSPSFLSDEVCFTACRMSDHLNARAIVGMTRSGYTGYKIAAYRPKAGIFIFTSHLPLLKTLNLVWGIRGFYYNQFNSTDDTFNDVNQTLLDKGLVKKGDVIINTASMPIKEKSRTNTIKVTVIS